MGDTLPPESLDSPLQLGDMERARASSPEGSQHSLVSTVPSAAGSSTLSPYELTDNDVTTLAIAQGDAAALAAKAPFPMPASLLQHLQQENKWQREQLRELQKQVERSEDAAVNSLRSSEQRSRELLRQLREEQQRREAAERTASAAASRVKEMYDEVAMHKVTAEGAQESERQMKQELMRVQEEAENFLQKATHARDAQTHAELQQRYAEEEMMRLRVDMHGLEARAAMMRGRLDDIDAAKMLVHEQGMRTAAATVIASGWRGRADRKLAFRALEIKSATMMQAHWRRYSARAEFRARLRMAQRNRQITQLQMAAGMLEQGRAHVLLLREKMAQEQKELEEQELAAAKEALQGWDGTVNVTIAIPAFLVGEDEALGGFKCLPARRLSDIRDMVEDEVDDAPEDWVFMLNSEPMLDRFDESDHMVQEYMQEGATPEDVVADREVTVYIQDRLIADPPPVIEDKPAEEEPIEEEPPYGIEHEAAAIRIQSRFRGRQARQWKAEQDEAAARIQARFRGNKVRRNMPAKEAEESDDDDSLDDLEQMVYKQLGKKLARDALTKPGDGPGEDKKVTGPTAVDREMDGSGIGEKMGIIVRLQELIVAAKHRFTADEKRLKGNLATSEAVAASTRQNAKNALKENHTKLKDDSDSSLKELLEANEATRTKANEHFDETKAQIKQVHAVLATLAIGMAEHTQLMGILDAMEANAERGSGDTKSGHNGLTGLLEDAHRRVHKNGQNFHDDLSDATGRMHDEMLEKIVLLNSHGVELNDNYRADMNLTLKAELGLMQKTVDQMRIRGFGLETDLADTNASLDRTRADLIKMTGKATVLGRDLASSQNETRSLKVEVVEQAEKEKKLVEQSEDMTHRLKIQEGTLSSLGQSLAVARIRATTATMAESQSALLKGQLTAVLELLRMRREVHHGTMTSLAPPTTREIMEHVNYLISMGQPYPKGLDPLYKAEEQRYGGDIRSGMLRLKSRVKTISTAGGPRASLEVAVVAPGLEDAEEEFVSSEFKIEPWATDFTIDQSDRSNEKLPIQLPEEFDAVYYINGEETELEAYCASLKKSRSPDEQYDAYIVAKATSGLIDATEENLSFRFSTDRELFYIDPLVGSDHNPGTERYPFQTVLHAAQQAARPEVVKEVRVLMRDQAADTVVLTLPAIVIAVISEEAMYAPLPDGWERSQDPKTGNTYYHNKWLAGRAPSYAHPMDTEFRRLCHQMLGLEYNVAEEYRDHQTRLDELPEFPSAVHIRERQQADGTVTEEVQPAQWTKGGSLSQFLDEAALGKYLEPIAKLFGAAMPEDMQELAKDEEALDEIGMLRLEKLRFKRVVETAFPEVVPEQAEVEQKDESLLQLEYKPVTEEVVVERQVLVVAATGLRKTDMMGKSDPYAVVYLDDEKVGQTDFLAKTLDPHWEAEIPVQIVQTYVDGVLQAVPGHRGAKVRVEIYDHDVSSGHDFLGQLELHSVEYSDDLTIPIQTMPLKGKGNKQGKVTGEITLALQDPSTVRPTVKRQLVVASATGLKAADRKVFGEGVSDPYAIVYWNDVEIAKTAVEDQTIDPVWETRVMLTIPDRGGLLRVEVYDHDVGSAHDFLGQVEQHVGPGGECNWDWDPDEMVLPGTSFPLCAKQDAEGDDAEGVQGKLTLRVENPIMRKLILMQAVGLRAADKKTSDPFAIVYWQGREVGQTKVEEKTLDPIWDADFEIAVDPDLCQGTLRIEVFDHDVGSKADFLGQVEVELGEDEYMYGGPGIVLDRRAFPLQPDPRKPTERIPGAIVFRIEDPTGELTPELQEDEGIARPATPQGMLEVTLVEARDLKKMDMLGKNDPYVVFTVQGRTMRSTTIDGGGAKPSWASMDGGGGEVLKFEVEQAIAVEMAVYDEDADADDLIGTAIVELDHAPMHEDWALEDWFEIEDKKGKTTGAVHLQMSWAMPRDRTLQNTQELQLQM